MSLISRVVDREHGGHVLGMALSQLSTEIDQCEGGVPVMRVENDRPGHQAGQGSDSGQGEESKATSVVGIVYCIFAIDPMPIEVLQMLNEKHLGT
jgi:hypothetical protein